MKMQTLSYDLSQPSLLRVMMAYGRSYYRATMQDPLFMLAKGLTAGGASRLHVLATDASSEALADLLLLLKEPQCNVDKA